MAAVGECDQPEVWLRFVIFNYYYVVNTWSTVNEKLCKLCFFQSQFIMTIKEKLHKLGLSIAFRNDNQKEAV